MSLLPAAAQALLELRFVTPPALPALPTLTLNGRTQSTTTAMTGFSVEDLRLLKAGWNLTAQGQTGAGRSAVFAPYCPKAKCGTAAEGYVPEGQALAKESLMLNSTGASFSGGLLTAPTLECSSGCALDSPTPVKIASETSGLLAGEGIWTAGGFSPTSLTLSTSPTLRTLPNEEVYRANILWTLSTGP
jgi:hypothetical protein